MSVRLGSKSSSGGGGGGGGGGGKWSVSKVTVKTHVDNYAPSVSDKTVTVSANAADGSGTIELPASDAECDAVTVQVTSLPTEGRLYLCSCSNVWTQPITPAMLPVDVSAAAAPGTCARVVYEPAANSPRGGDVAAGDVFDSFRFRAKDAKGSVSREATATW